jgi:hypothetical protein
MVLEIVLLLVTLAVAVALVLARGSSPRSSTWTP